MTIEELLRKVQGQHGNNWLRYALNRFLGLQSKTPLTQKELEEYDLLYDWALEMIEAGIAFKQSQSIEK